MVQVQGSFQMSLFKRDLRRQCRIQISVPMTVSDLIFSFLERAVIDLLLAIIIQLTQQVESM